MQKRPNGFISLQEGNFHTPFGDEFHPQPQMAMYRTVAYPCLDNLLTLAKRWLKLCSLPCSFVYSCYPPSSQWPLLGSCRGGRTCAVQPGPRVSTSGVPPRPGVSPPAAAFRARMASVVGFLLYWAAFPSAARGPAGLAWGGPEQPSVDDTRAPLCSSCCSSGLVASAAGL